MSHYSTIAVNLDDEASIKAACNELDLKFRLNSKVKGYYGHGETCDMVIEIQGSPYEVGLRRNGKGGYDLIYDKFGGHVEKVLGKDCKKLVESATYHKVTKTARKLGYLIQRKNKQGGGIQVILSRAG
jgi:hypothetical protein